MSTEYLNNKAFEEIINKFQQSSRNKLKYELIIEDLKKTLERKNTRVPAHKRKKPEEIFASNEKFKMYEQSIKEYELSKSELARAFYLLSENIVRYAKFELIDPDDAVQEGVMICFEKIDRFNSNKGKAFNYLTTCILNNMRQLYRTSRNYNELKKKYQEFCDITFKIVR